MQAAGDTFAAEEESFYQGIKLLQSHGVNVADCRYQEVEGCWYLHSRGDSDDNDKKLCRIKGLSEAMVDKMKEAVLEDMWNQSWLLHCPSAIFEQRRNLLRLTIGFIKLNMLPRGSLESMTITEVFGEFRTGKT